MKLAENNLSAISKRNVSYTFDMNFQVFTTIVMVLIITFAFLPFIMQESWQIENCSNFDLPPLLYNLQDGETK